LRKCNSQEGLLEVSAALSLYAGKNEVHVYLEALRVIEIQNENFDLV